MHEFKDRLKSLRKEKGLTQVKLGALLNYGYTAIANYESGRNQPGIADLKKIASIFDVSLDYLLGVTDIRRPYASAEDPLLENEFLRYFTMLNEESQKDVLLYTQWLLEREERQKTAETEAGHSHLRVAQTKKEYKKD
ncbi:helix-turn-helix transcriptional regulator [Anaerotignum lactatifermentans]|uniref:Helix-turn-helix transcriptional regulator n=1 Tax=Anaerotignum lactatifermentans TaxID=160404 RepID=A0ABS2G7N2_9FIRM|nr:helix-turn-helix transcriptional regulator [Anaerotignum lactatifermentans]MBM6828069.1 helix-turn-helix transcriptional regulator [Anaerotignum lactatifermentans]MBM6876768.1 helix-turn-helix transcriptional regulator [Anaerotignum lactatifermentans]MBM6949652.1 helix-turn-helix transcriptional regulator [Anaerotignum lactatifermentans]